MRLHLIGAVAAAVVIAGVPPPQKIALVRVFPNPGQIGLFIAAAVFHLCLMMVGGLNQSTSRFEGTFRTVSYSSVSMLANIIPFVGGLIGLVWGFFLNVKGAVRMHKTTPGKALAALLIPLAIVILLLIAVLAIVVGMIVATRPSGSL